MKMNSILLPKFKVFCHVFYMLDEEAAFLDKSNIISGGRRTRGKRIDYSKFGPDDEDDE